ncbi:Lrp/AsnC family transcriptional regulator [Salinarimonas rosea]|uniref:Lrp/AsnC family transcriptional regulator n=1 Tax=Salinarimonas rosea TaxID=552063 RepID=UPI00048EE17C|nr:Lrp/AsnC family transcriptional regulator [Salinarimonas rosea]
MTEKFTLDAIDRRILACLQEDATQPLDALAAQVGLSPSPLWRRIRKLEEAGVILRRVALLDPDRLNVGVTVFVMVRTSRHEADWARRFCEAVAKIPEVVELWRMSGQVDYLLRVVVPDIAAYDRVYKRLIAVADLYDVSSSFAMERIKNTTALPLDYA